MSSPPASDDQHDAADEAPAEGAQSPASEEPETAVEPVECPNCGREFADNYCPECGQKADPSASVVEVIGGFFRELVDVEHGFWPTFVGLTLRPGEVLQQYLSGVRAGLISPGRYILVAVVVSAGTRQFSRWIGASPPPVVDPYMTADGKRDASEVSLAYFISIAVEQAEFIFFLMVVVPLAFSLWTLFRDRFNQGAETLAAGSFLVAHTKLLGEGIDLAFTGVEHLLAGPSLDLPYQAVIVFMTAYVGFACWGGFGPSWKSAVKGALAGFWAWAECLAIMGIVLTGSVYWLCRTYPSDYYGFGSPANEVPGEAQIWVYLIIAVVFSVPLLVHAGVEVYLRYRD